MITDDDVMRLFERADPARRDDNAPAADAAGCIATLRTRSSNVTLIDTEPTMPGPKTGHRWPIIAAAAAVAAILVGALVLVARDDDPSDQVPAATTVTPDTATTVHVPLAEGVYRTPELTREQLIATGVAAGFDRAHVEAFVDRDGIQNTARWDLRLADGDWKVLYRYDGWHGRVAWQGTYEVVDEDTVIATDPCGPITYQYTFDGEHLTLDMVDDQCDGGVGELIAQTIIFETAPFTLVEPAGPQG